MTKARSGTSEVAAFMRALKHPHKEAVERLREVVRAATPDLVERIKWNAPSFGFEDDRVTFRLESKEGIQVILHRGAKVKDTAGFRFEDPSGLATWAAPDRGVVSFADLPDVEAKAGKMQALVSAWMAATG